MGSFLHSEYLGKNVLREHYKHLEMHISSSDFQKIEDWFHSCRSVKIKSVPLLLADSWVVL